MVTNWSILVRRGLFLIIGVLLMVGQVSAQERGLSGPQFVCLNSRVNPSNDTEDLSPAVSEDYVVWVGYEDGEEGEIFAMDRDTDLVTQITDNDYEDMNPQVDGDYVVWQYLNPDNDTYDIALYNLTAGTTQFLNPNTAEDWTPLIEDNIVVWSQAGAINRVKYYDITTGTLSNLGGGFGADTYWAYGLQNGRILYGHQDAQPDGTHYFVYVYNIATATSTLASDELPTLDGKYDLQFDGDVVVWENWPNLLPMSAYEIYAYNMASEDLIPVTDNNVIDMEPAVKGDYVAYISAPGGGHEMRLYNLNSGSDILLDSEPVETYYDPFIGDDMIAWQSINGIHVYPMEGTRSYKATDFEGGDDLILRGNRIFWSGQKPGEQDYDIFMLDCGFEPEIVSQPQDVEIESGETAILSVEAEGDGNLKYQWYDNAGDTPIIGATSSTFVTTPLTETKEFYVQVSNKYGAVYSLLATVLVNEVTATETPSSETTSTPTLEVTLTPSLTPTPTLPGSVQILPNTDFELDADGDKIPDGWSAKGTTLPKSDKLKRNKLNQDGTVKVVAYSGDAAFMFKGNPDGQKSKLAYKLTDFGVISDGSRLELSVYVNRFKVTPGTMIGKGKIKFSDGSKETLQLAVPAAQGYTSVSDLIVVDLDGRTIEKLKIEFGTNMTSGKFVIDRASLLVIPLELAADTGLVPLP